MDIQFWIWIAIIAVSFIAKAMKKKPEEDADPQNLPKKDPLGPVSFEELLREIQQAKAPKPTPKPVPQPVEITDYREIIQQEQAKLEEVRPLYVPSERTNEIYEKARREAFTRPSLEETMRIEDTVVRFDKFKGYQKQEQSLALDFVKELQNVNGLKKAFVLNEVLMRKF